jgi:hypothetical protein
MIVVASFRIHKLEIIWTYVLNYDLDFLFKTQLFGTRFCPRLQAERIQLDPKDGGSLYPETEASSVYWDQTEYVPSEDVDRIQSLRRCVLNKK